MDERSQMDSGAAVLLEVSFSFQRSGRQSGRTPLGECGGLFLPEARIAWRRRRFGRSIALGRLFSVEWRSTRRRDCRSGHSGISRDRLPR
jgi:hypothetical protein